MNDYISTRDAHQSVSSKQAILNGMSPDGGLYVLPTLDQIHLDLSLICTMSYKENAVYILSHLLTDYTKEELEACVENAYANSFSKQEITPIKKVDDVYVLELFHGPTCAFKDVALTLLPQLMSCALKSTSQKALILTATSGDTGKAALSGFCDVENIGINVFYPYKKVSAIQYRQMVTQKGKNVNVFGIQGNFDDAQSGVKAMFNNKELAAAMDAKGYQFSSANSINIGRLVPQVVYYVYAYTRLLGSGTVAEGEPVNFVVPTGNFGNILAAFYAKNMGIPVGKLICASNENKVLYDFFDTGIYDRNREFVLTSSPSMDILISSNLERLIYRIAGEDAAKTKEMMDALSADGKYTLTEEMKAQLADFVGGWASEEKTAAEIKRVYDATGYVMDTHTAVASAVYKEYKDRTGDETKTVIASTASPYKFATSVMTAIDAKYEGMDDFALIDELSKVSGVSIPQAVEEIRSAPVLHDTVCETADMQKTVETILGL